MWYTQNFSPNAVLWQTLFTFKHPFTVCSSRDFSHSSQGAATPDTPALYTSSSSIFPELFFCCLPFNLPLLALLLLARYLRYLGLGHTAHSLYTTLRQHTLNGTVHTDFELCFTLRFAHSALADAFLLTSSSSSPCSLAATCFALDMNGFHTHAQSFIGVLFVATKVLYLSIVCRDASHMSRRERNRYDDNQWRVASSGVLCEMDSRYFRSFSEWVEWL